MSDPVVQASTAVNALNWPEAAVLIALCCFAAVAVWAFSRK